MVSEGKLRLREIIAKSILNPSRISGVGYAINPYVGCQHGCIYCYARFMRKYTGHMGEEWGSFVDAKINAPRLLNQQLRRRRTPVKEAVLLSSVTDAYQPVEQRYKLTRNCLELLRNHDISVSILTKSNLVLRDIDLFGDISNCEVGMTIITLDEKVRQVFESGAPPSERRLSALQRLTEQGIRTYGFVGPIIPHLSSPTLEELIRRLAESGVRYILFDRLNLKYGNQPLIEKALQTTFPEQYTIIQNALRKGSSYYEDLRAELVDFAQYYGVDADIIF